MFATPVRGLELSEIWGLFIQIREILLQQWNCVFSPLDVAVFLFPSCFRTSSIILYVSEFFPFHAQKFRSFIGSRTRVLSFRSPMFFHCASRPRQIIHLLPLKNNSMRYDKIRLHPLLKVFSGGSFTLFNPLLIFQVSPK